MAVRVGVQDLMTILEAHPDNKIQRVKAVREKWLFGLKTAKDIVEAYDRLLTDLTEIRYS
jgi:ribosomal protein L7/L12